MEKEPKNKSIFKTYLIYFISMALFCGLRIFTSLDINLGIGSKTTDILFTLVVQLGVMFLIPFTLYMLFLRQTPKQVFKTCNFSKVNLPTIFISLALGVIIFILNIIVSSIFNGVITFVGYRTPLSFAKGLEPDYSVGNFFLQVLLVAVLPGFCEEFLHRGILLQGTKHAGFKRAIIISAICFGLIHFNIAQVSYAVVLGIVLGFASVVAKNIWVPIIMHFTNNFIALYLEFAEVNGWFLGDYSSVFSWLASHNFVMIVVIAFFVMLFISIALIYLMTQLFKQNILRKINKAIDKMYGGNHLSGNPVLLDSNKFFQEIIETKTMINLNYEEMKSPLDMIMPKQKSIYLTTLKDNLFLISTFILGFTVTIFTFVWGLL